MTTPTQEQRLAQDWSGTLTPDDFLPRRRLANGHLQTLVGNFLRRQHQLPEAEGRIIEVSPKLASPGPTDPVGARLGASHVLCHCHWQPDPERRFTVLIVHGLEGSSSSQYMLGNAARAWSHGCNVVRMNMRNCGGTEHLSPTLYNSGLSGDVAAVMRALVEERGIEAFGLVGYSMGGNMVLKLAGELGDAAPGYLKAVVGVSPLMDLAISADALHLRQNRIYEWHFMRRLRDRFRLKARLYPEIYSTDGLDNTRTIREFDDLVTAPYSGYGTASNYYATASSSRVASRIAVPTLILLAKDDPFIRTLDSTREAVKANPRITFVEPAHGGHCAFLAAPNGYDGYWAEKTLLNFLLHAAAGSHDQPPR